MGIERKGRVEEERLTGRRAQGRDTVERDSVLLLPAAVMKGPD